MRLQTSDIGYQSSRDQTPVAASAETRKNIIINGGDQRLGVRCRHSRVPDRLAAECNRKTAGCVEGEHADRTAEIEAPDVLIAVGGFFGSQKKRLPAVCVVCGDKVVFPKFGEGNIAVAIDDAESAHGVVTVDTVFEGYPGKGGDDLGTGKAFGMFKTDDRKIG
ncbi:MAG: hypothetical protein IJM57_02520 [Lachnospiraceae bacterium]|nr:hypothetical protein [Lachnospiraceae bacterium]